MSKTIDIDVEVTEQDIVSGERYSLRYCPIGMAISREQPLAYNVSIGEDDAGFFIGKEYFYASLPCKANEFIEKFDHAKPVSPISFKAVFRCEGA